MARRVFTDRWLKSLKPAPAGKRLTEWDSILQNFCLRISDSGSVRPLVNARPAGWKDPIRVSVARSWRCPLPPGGDIPVPLADMRKEAGAVLLEMSRGIDPRATRRARAHAAELDKERTLDAVLEKYLKEGAPTKSGPAVARLLRRELATFSDLPISQFGRREVTKLVKTKVAAGRRALAQKVWRLTSAFLAWTASDGDFGIETNPLAGVRLKNIVGALPPRQRILSDRELKILWEATAPDGPIGYPLAQFVRALLLIGGRLREIAGMRWGEIDLAAKVWICPAVRMKSGSPHSIPLTAGMLALLAELPRIGDCDFVFSTDGRRAIAGFSSLKARLDHQLAGVAPWRFHDARRTFRTGLGALPVPNHVAELLLAHSRTGVRRVYDLHAYLDEKRAALALWEARLLSIVEP